MRVGGCSVSQAIHGAWGSLRASPFPAIWPSSDADPCMPRAYLEEPMTELRPATPADVPALAALKRDTFRETFLEDFAIPYPQADLMVFEASAYGVDAVARELADPQRRTWVVSEGDELLAYAQVGPCKLPHPDVAPAAGELYQLYARRGAQGQGLGRALLDVALDHLATAFAGPAWIGVWSGNLRAQRVYLARGFEKVGEYDFPVGSWMDHEFILRRG